jgi:hypothetical protein
VNENGARELGDGAADFFMGLESFGEDSDECGNDVWAEELPGVALWDLEGVVEGAFGVGDEVCVLEAVCVEHLEREFLVFGLEDDGDIGAFVADRGLLFGEVVEGFYAERAAGVAEERDEEWFFVGDLGEGRSVLGGETGECVPELVALLHGVMVSGCGGLLFGVDA